MVGSRLCGGFTALLIAFAVSANLNASIWINEFHYDNAGTDTGEFVELVVSPSSSINLADVLLTLYNGANGQQYGTNVAGTSFLLGSLVNGYQFYHVAYPTDGIQNGAPDGIALSVASSVELFLSYEGTFAATNGIANGMTSTSVGVAESSSTPVGASLSLIGAGNEYSDFTWAVTAKNTPGNVNGGQTLQAAVPEAATFLIWTALFGAALVGGRRYGELI